MIDKGRAAIAELSNRLESLTIEYVSVDDVHPNSYNPNRMSERDLMILEKSIRDHGFTQPILVQSPDAEFEPNSIVDGEHRWRKAQEMGYTLIPAVRVNMTKVQMQLATFQHNRARGSEDIELSTKLLKDLQQLDALKWAQDSLDLDDDFVNKLLQDTTAAEALAGAEFNEAWVPSSEPGDQQGGGSESTTEVRGGVVQRSATTEAVQAAADAEKRLANAQSEEEKAQLRRETKVIPFYFTFKHEDAEVVQAVLGENPSERLLALCQRVVDGADVAPVLEPV